MALGNIVTFLNIYQFSFLKYKSYYLKYYKCQRGSAKLRGYFIVMMRGK